MIDSSGSRMVVLMINSGRYFQPYHARDPFVQLNPPIHFSVRCQIVVVLLLTLSRLADMVRNHENLLGGSKQLG